MTTIPSNLKVGSKVRYIEAGETPSMRRIEGVISEMGHKTCVVDVTVGNTSHPVGVPIFPKLSNLVELVEVEAVEHPAHYGGDTPYEVIKVAEAWGFEKNAYLFNALKYLARADKKGRKVEDLNKLVFYVKREIALEEAK